MAEGTAVLTPPRNDGVVIQYIDEAPSYLKALIYAYPGVGKTWLAATAPDPLFLISEDAVAKETLRAYYKATGKRIPFIDIRHTNDLKRAFAWVASQLDKGEATFKTVVLDSLTDTQKMMARDLVREGIERGYYDNRENRNTEVLERGEWNWLANRTRNMIRSFRDLPCHVVMTAQVTQVKGELVEAPSVQPNSFALEAPGLFNMVARLEVVHDEDGNAIRVLRCESDGEFFAKNPQGALPKAIRNPDMSKIVEILNSERSA